MKINIWAIIVLNLTVPGAVAYDVYSTFIQDKDDIKSRIGHYNFDVSNPGCFDIAGAGSISFSAFGHSNFNGPYCLLAYKKAGCESGNFIDSIQYEGILGNQHGSGDLPLASELDGHPGSFRWKTTGCSDPDHKTVGQYSGQW